MADKDDTNTVLSKLLSHAQETVAPWQNTLQDLAAQADVLFEDVPDQIDLDFEELPPPVLQCAARPSPPC
jgi:hypothetical protein